MMSLMFSMQFTFDQANRLTAKYFENKKDVVAFEKMGF